MPESYKSMKSQTTSAQQFSFLQQDNHERLPLTSSSIQTSHLNTFGLKNQNSSYTNIKVNGRQRHSAHEEMPRSNNSYSDSNSSNFVRRQMANSTMAFSQNKNIEVPQTGKPGGQLFNMAREVSEPVDQPQTAEQVKTGKQDNKYSFLQVPKLQGSKTSMTLNESSSKRSFLGASQIQAKSTTFVKNNSVSSFNRSEKKDNSLGNSGRRQSNLNFFPKKIESIGAKSAKGSQSSKNKSHTFDSISNSIEAKLGGCSKIMVNVNQSNISPVDSSKNSQKYKSTRQPEGTSTLDQQQSRQGSRKNSMFMTEDRQFYTPTQKYTANSIQNHTSTQGLKGSSNFFENRNFTTSNKKSKFLSISELKANFSSTHQSSDDDKSEKVHEQNGSIPSFIKFKDRRNGSLPISQKNSQQQFKQISLQDFEIKDRLGKGAFGDVFLARQIETGFFCVLKKLSKKKIKEQKLQEHILRQIKIQAALSHKHLTALYGFFDDEQYIYLVLEYLSDGSLAQKVGRRKCPQKEVSAYIRQVCEGLKFMHIQEIIHRDIKPQNVFIHENYLKIGDFGCSVCSSTKRNTVVGCLAYISPQQLNNESYDDKIDVWSVGILTYQLLTARSPFEEDIVKITRQLKQAKLSELKFPSNLQLSDDVKQFIQSLLNEIPQNRMTISEALRHPFIVKHLPVSQASLGLTF